MCVSERRCRLFNFSTAKAIPLQGKAGPVNKQENFCQFSGFRNHRQQAVSFQSLLTAFIKTAEVNKTVRIQFNPKFPTFHVSKKDIYTESLIYQRLVASGNQMATLYG